MCDENKSEGDCICIGWVLFLALGQEWMVPNAAGSVSG